MESANINQVDQTKGLVPTKTPGVYHMEGRIVVVLTSKGRTRLS